jgi:hypothetical protein
MSQVFISYSRKDQSFVEQLHAALTYREKDTWVDWKDIPPTAKWIREIYDGIEAADNFLFVISPDSINSPICKKEIEHAIHHNKRFIPLIFRDVKSEHLPEPVATHNWINFRDNSEFNKSIESLLFTIDTDFDYVRTHTQLLLKALEWNTYGKDESYLLTGAELRMAEKWLASSTGKQPEPTLLHREHIATSTKVEQESKAQRHTRQQYSAIRDKALKEYIRPYLDQRKQDLENRKESLAKNGFLRFSKEVTDVEEEINGLLNFLDSGGRWHPEEPISVKALGAQEDYLESYEFACCGKSVLADRPPSRFRSDGCQASPILSEGDE